MFPQTEHDYFFQVLEVLNKRFSDIRVRKSPVQVRMHRDHYRGNLLVEYKGGQIVLSLESWGREVVPFLSVVPGTASFDFDMNYNCYQYFSFVRGSNTFINAEDDPKMSFSSSYELMKYSFENELYKHAEEFSFSLDLEYKNEYFKKMVELVARFKRTPFSEFEAVVVKNKEIANLSIYFEDLVYSMNRSPYFWKNFE